MENKKINWQGHRGCRGLLPENTIPAFIKAMNIGVDTLEMDIAVSKDEKIIITHEPWMSHEICLRENGNSFSKKIEKELKIFNLNYWEIKKYDCGSKGNKKFPTQVKIKTHKPHLLEVFAACEEHLKQINLKTISYNIEIKSKPEWDNIFTPGPQIINDLLIKEIKTANIAPERLTLQSFDMRILRILHQQHPQYPLALLIENEYDSLDQLIDELGFQTPIFSPYFKLLNKERIAEAHQKGIKVIPWTVNEVEDMERLIKWGIDGIITDYPDVGMGLYIN